MTRETDLYSAVSNALWVQREALQCLLFKLVCEQLVLTSGSSRFLACADQEVRVAIERLRAGELLRSAEAQELAALLGLDADASLSELADHSAEPWATLFAEHRTALRGLVHEVNGVADENQRLLATGAKAVRETLAEISDVVTRYDATGRAVQFQPRSMLLDEQA